MSDFKPKSPSKIWKTKALGFNAEDEPIFERPSKKPFLPVQQCDELPILGIPLLKFDGQTLNQEELFWKTLLGLIFSQSNETNEETLAKTMFESRVNFMKAQGLIETALTCGIPITNHGND